MKNHHLVFALGLAALLCVSAVPAPASSSAAGFDNPTQPETPARKIAEPAPLSSETVIIPGPRRSFLRMAAISQEISNDQIIPLLAHNVFTLGFEDHRETEYLVLLDRYVAQARQLQALAGAAQVIHIDGCNQAGPLLAILGYRLSGTCGQKSMRLETSNPERAFLTSDSGFPLTALGEALEANLPYSYPYASTSAPVLTPAHRWTAIGSWRLGRGQDLLDALLHDPHLARLYWAFSRMDGETQQSLYRSPGLKKLLPYAGVLDFYGSEIVVRSGQVITPGGDSAAREWSRLVGANPQRPGEFILHLVERNRGWLAAYYDVLSRISAPQQAQLTSAPRLRLLYDAFRAPKPDEDAANASFRKAPLLLVLYTRLRWNANGEPYVPGNLKVWRQIIESPSDSSIVRHWHRRAGHINTPQDLLEAMVAFTRAVTDNTPLQIYLTASEIDRRRAPQNRMTPETLLMLARNYPSLKSWEPLFSEFPTLNDNSIQLFIHTAEATGRIPDDMLRANALGILQANLGLWQIFARQGQIPEENLNTSWQRVLNPFAKISTSAQLYDAGAKALSEICLAAGGPADPSQEEIVNLLAGPAQQTPAGREIHDEIAARIQSVLAGQRLASLDAILPLGSGLQQMAQGAAASPSLMPLAEELRDFQMPRPIFTRSEKDKWAPGVYSNRHVEVQTRADLTKALRSPISKAAVEQARGELTLYLRDTLVGFNYAYYEPPGAQMLHNNPLFVRSHDFTGETIRGMAQEPYWGAAEVVNAGSPAGGGAYLLGSLSNLPYALATTEEDFLAPANVQALVWTEVVPDLLVSSTLPRWWTVTPHELHAVALYQEAGEELLRAASKDQNLRTKVIGILSESMPPQELDSVAAALRSGDANGILSKIPPADTLYLTAGFRKQYPEDAGRWGAKGKELEALIKQYPSETSWSRLSRDFGVPHPVLTHSYARELLDVQPFPAFEGSASQLFSESWDSTNLYWARLADEAGDPPVALNRLVPMLTRKMATNIFASDLEDWPAVLRAMRQTGQEFLQGQLALPAAPTITSSLQ